MVSLSNLFTLGLVGVGILSFIKLGGASGIGSRIGGGFSDFIGGISDSFKPVSSIQSIVGDLGLINKVTGLPNEERPITEPEKGLVSLAGVLQQENYSGVINVEEQTFENRYTVQPLDFAITTSGNVRTGTVGLGQSTIAAQQALSQKFGIPTFDVEGNISTFAGLVSGNGGNGGQTGGSPGGQTGGNSDNSSAPSSAPSNASAAHKKAFGRR